MKKTIVLSMVAAFATGCATGPGTPVADAGGAAARELKIAVFTGNGARNAGAFRWLEIATMSKGVEAVPVDGAAVRAGALEGVDVLVMPGGRATLEANDLGEEGRRMLKDYLWNGGGYIGTCAGCYLLLEPHAKDKKYLSVIPYKDGTSGGRADLLVEFNEKARSLAGIKPAKRRLRYAHGPVPVPTGHAIEGSKFDVVATYASDINQTGKARKSFAGRPAAFAGTYGKGRVFVFTVHPESDVDDHNLIKGAFKFLTGRDLEWEYPQRREGQLAVGFMCDDSFGPVTARLVQKMLKAREFDLVPLNATAVSEGALRHVDAVLAPPTATGKNSEGGLYGDNLGRTKEFLGRGARIIAWGDARGMAARNGVKVTEAKDGEAAIAALRAFAAEPVPAPKPFPAKVAKPVKIAVFADDGCSMGNIPPALEFSPEYEVGIVSGKDVANGALDKYEALYMPGGYSSIAYVSLGDKGHTNLVDFVRRGGKYYGVCGGSFLISQTRFKKGNAGMKSGKTPFLGLIPYKEDLPHLYRGKAGVRIRLTEEGKKIFPGSAEVRAMRYAGGPAFVKADKVDDAEYKVFARYGGCIVNTCHSEPSPSMLGKVAMVGGRVGKGRVFAQCPHPEAYEYSFDMVRDIFKYLTGVRPSEAHVDRVRGAKSVLVKMGFRKGMNEAVKFVLKTLLHDRRFDCKIANTMDNNALENADAVVMCLFDKTSWTPELKRFAANGGKVVFVAETPEKRKIAAKFEGARVVDSYGKVVSELLRNGVRPQNGQ